MMIGWDKAQQATALLDEFDLGAWMILVRETGEHSDPVLKLFGDPHAVWPAAFVFARSGERIAVTGLGDDQPVRQQGLFDPIHTYTQSIRESLVGVLEQLDPDVIGINYSRDDVTADGLTHGMYLNLLRYLEGTPYAGRLVSAELFVEALRGRKTAGERALVQRAIRETDAVFQEVGDWLRAGLSELEIAYFVRERVFRRGLALAWDAEGCPGLNAGPSSPWGHAGPAADVRVAAGDTLNMDLGVQVEGYCSDLQRVWYFLRPGELEPPAEVMRAFAAVAGAIQTASGLVRPGVPGWEVDAAARSYLTKAGYPEFPHALGHSVGRSAHDGGTGFYPRWDRYGGKPYGRLAAGGIYTLELGVRSPVGYIGLEEMIAITEDGCEWLSEPQRAPYLVAG